MATATSFKDSKLYLAIKQPTESTWKTVQDEITNNEDSARLTGESGETFFHLIAIHCQPKAVDYLIPVIYQLANAGVDVNLMDFFGNSALTLCLLNRASYRLIDAFVKVGAAPQVGWETMRGIEDPLVATIIRQAHPGLWKAAMSSDYSKVATLLDSWFSVDLVCNGKSLLSAVAETGASDELTTLLRRRAPVIRLAHAALASNLKATRMLLEEADRDDQLRIVANATEADKLFDDGRVAASPLLAEVIRLGHVDVAQILVEAGADVNVTIHTENRETPQNTPLFVWTLTRGRKLDQTLLSLILESADLSLVENHSDFLYGLWSNECSLTDLHEAFDRGLSLSARNSDGYTIRELILIETMQFDVALIKTSLQFVDRYAMNLALEEDIEALDKLAGDGYEYMNPMDANGQTTLEMTIRHQKMKSVQFYQRLPQFQKSWQQLHLAIEKGNLFEAREHMNEKSVVVKDRAGRNALHKAILYERKHIVKFIIKDFAKLTMNGLDNMKRSPLHYAYCNEDAEDVVDQLISAGASQTFLDMEGRSASEYAKQPGYRFLETERLRYYGHRVFLIDRYLTIVNTINSSTIPSIDRIDDLIDSLNPFVLNDLDQIAPHMKWHRYRPLIFLCVDKDLEDVAIHLIKRGASYEVSDKRRRGTKMATTTLLEAAENRNLIRLINAIKDQLTADKQKRMVQRINDAALHMTCDDDFGGSVSLASGWSNSTGRRSTRSTLLLQSSLSRAASGRRSGNPGGDIPLDDHHQQPSAGRPSPILSTNTPKTSSSCTFL